MREDGGCDAGISHETGLATRLQTMRSYMSCIPITKCVAIGLTNKSISMLSKMPTTTLPRQHSCLNYSPERTVERAQITIVKVSGRGPQALSMVRKAFLQVLRGITSLGSRGGVLLIWERDMLGIGSKCRDSSVGRDLTRKTKKKFRRVRISGEDEALHGLRLYLEVDSPQRARILPDLRA